MFVFCYQLAVIVRLRTFYKALLPLFRSGVAYADEPDDCINRSTIELLNIYVTMDGERKIHLCEGVPLNSSGSANIFLNTGKNKVNPDGTVIHLKTGDLDIKLTDNFFIYKNYRK